MALLAEEKKRSIKHTDVLGNPPTYDMVILEARWRRKQTIDANRTKLEELKKQLAENIEKGVSGEAIINIIGILEEMLVREAERDVLIYGPAHDALNAHRAKLAAQKKANSR